MTWNLDSALITTFTLVRDNFMAFFAVALLFTAPTLLIGFVDDGFVVTLVVGVIANILLTVSLTIGAAQALAGARPGFAVLVQQIRRPDLGKLLALGVVQHGDHAGSDRAHRTWPLRAQSLDGGYAGHHRRATDRGRSARPQRGVDPRPAVAGLGVFVLVAIPAILVVEILGALTGMVIVTWLLEAALDRPGRPDVVLYASLRGEKKDTTPALSPPVCYLLHKPFPPAKAAADVRRHPAIGMRAAGSRPSLRRGV